MRFCCCRFTRPVKLAVPCFLSVFFIVCYYINNTATTLSSLVPAGRVVRLKGSVPEHAGTFPDLSGPSCPPGFYSEEELKPGLKRPLQDPTAPGANGKPFVSHLMTSEEHKEESRGFNKNQFNQFASDRISLHRDLGKDTRHPEWVTPQLHMISA